MKVLLSLFTAISLFSPGTNSDDYISTYERAFLTNLFTVSSEKLEETIVPLNDQQWNYKPSEDQWSVAQCFDHILIAEEALFQQIKKALQEAPDRVLQTRHLDGWLLSKIADRGNKVKTPLPPRSQLASKDQMLADFKLSRQRIADFLAQEELPLRVHFGTSPYGPADCYQLLMVIAAHSLRHHAQIEEVLMMQKSN